MKTFGKVLSIVLALIMVLSLVACGQGSEPADDGATEELTTLRIAQSTEPATLDLQSVSLGGNRSVAHSIMDNLVYINDDKTGLKPGLAESWEWVDETTLKMVIRQNVTSSKGTPFTAHDALFVLQRGAACSALSNKYGYFDIENSYCEDDYTLILKLPKAFSNAPYVLTTGCFVMYCQKDFEELGQEAFARAPIGTGPYVLDEWVVGSHLSVTRRDDYWGEKGTFEHIVWTFISDANSRALALQSGDADLANDLTLSMANTIASVDGLEAWQNKSNYALELNLNCNNPYFSDVRVRQAINIGINKQALADVLSPGDKASSGFFHHNSPYWNGKEFEYDLDKALQLLADAGYADGFEFTLMVLNLQDYINCAEALQGEMKKLNITMNIETLDSGSFFPKMFAGEYDIYLMNGSGFVPDDMLCFFDSAGLNGGGNFTGYSNPKFDELYYASQAELDDAKRAELYKQIDDLLTEECPKVNLFETDTWYGSVAGIRAFENDSIGHTFYNHAINPTT